MSTLIQNIVQQAQFETKSTTEPGVRSPNWVQFVCDAITEAFQIDPCLRIQSLRNATQVTPADVISPCPFVLDPDSGDPLQFEIPGSLEPFVDGLKWYVIFRYLATTPDNEKNAELAYIKFQRIMGVPQASPRE